MVCVKALALWAKATPGCKRSCHREEMFCHSRVTEMEDYGDRRVLGHGLANGFFSWDMKKSLTLKRLGWMLMW